MYPRDHVINSTRIIYDIYDIYIYSYYAALCSGISNIIHMCVCECVHNTRIVILVSGSPSTVLRGGDENITNTEVLRGPTCGNHRRKRK